MDRLFATSRFHFAYAVGNMFAALRIGASNILLERWAAAPSVGETVERFKLGESEIGLAEIVLYVVPAPGAEGSAAVAAARERLSRALPPYKRPRRFEIAHDLPRTATGKVQRNKLRERGRLDPR
jgi:hypothetical protein